MPYILVVAAADTVAVAVAKHLVEHQTADRVANYIKYARQCLLINPLNEFQARKHTRQ